MMLTPTGNGSGGVHFEPSATTHQCFILDIE
jgi:hypothetical protein